MTQPSQVPGAPTDAGQDGQAPTPQQPGTTPPQDGQAPTDGPQDINALPEWAQKLITDTRSEAAGHRTKYKTATQQAQEATAQRDKVLSALGLKPDGTEDQSPERLTAQLQQFQADLWERTVENTVLRSASKLGADADALLDSNKFLESLTDLADGADLEAHIASFVAANPKFKAAKGLGRSGGDFGGAPNQQPASLASQIRDAESKGDWKTARQLKSQLMLQPNQ